MNAYKDKKMQKYFIRILCHKTTILNQMLKMQANGKVLFCSQIPHIQFIIFT